MQRRDLLKAMAAFGVYAMVPSFARGANGAKKYDGVTLNVSTFSTAYPTLLRQWLPEFEALTGAKVNFDTPAFPVYNQRADLELSTKGSAYDVVNVTFIYTSRWINSGWLTPLDEFIANPNLTSAEWDVHDFLAGGLGPETGRDGKLYGIPWVLEGMLSGASRFDLVTQAGLKYPDTTDDLVKVFQAVNKKERVAAYVTDSHYGWTFIPYLQAFGGNVFRNPPDDLFPTLDTPEAIAAADYFARLIREFGPNGGLTYTADQSTQALKLGRVNFSDSSQAYLAQLGDPASSRTLKTVNFGQLVQGPAGRFPGMAVHALGIPAGSKNKEAAWVLTRWQFPGRRYVALWILVTRMAPPIAFTIPFYLAWRWLGLQDTVIGLAIVYLTFNLAIVIWLMQTFFAAVPPALEEAAWLDGCSIWRTFWTITLPLVAPGLAATAILCFIFSWNDFFYALILTRTQAVTAPVAIVNFLQYEGWEWSKIAASGTLVMLPVVAFTLLVRRYLVHGLTAGGLKD